MTCPDPILGDVTGETGLTPLVDATALDRGAAAHPYQWQYPALLTDKTGACAHYRANQIVQGEKWLTITLVGSRSPMDFQTCPLPLAPLTLTIGQSYLDGQGNLYTVAAHYAPHNGNCKEQGGGDATAGTVTYTTLTDSEVSGSYDLTFAAGHFTGTFIAPACPTAGCPPRPSRSSCVTS